MNVIEAIQAAKDGALITNSFLKSIKRFLKYVGNGIFYEYEIVPVDPLAKEGEIKYKEQYCFEVRVFSILYIMDNTWETVEDKWFKK